MEKRVSKWVKSITLSRECEAIEIPSGVPAVIPAGTGVRVMQILGSGYTVSSARGNVSHRRAKMRMRWASRPSRLRKHRPPKQGAVQRKNGLGPVEDVFDPEIPVNIADLGLDLFLRASLRSMTGGNKIDIKMSMTAPGCGMGNVLKADVETKLAKLPDVKQVNVEIVFDPAWSPARMSEAAKLQLGFDI